MITITFKSKDGLCQGFDAIGHAGYAPIGQDIVCAAVSALIQGTALAIEKMSGSETEIAENVLGDYRFQARSPDGVAQILLAGLEIALQEIQTEYGTYVEVCHG